MKKFITICLAAVMLSTATGCFGEFALVRSVYEWNDDVADSRFVKTLLFYAMNIIPVYGVAGAIDFWILNLIEFWTGDNPMSMNEGEMDRQIIPLEGEEYIVEATKNQFKIYQEGMEPIYLRFEESDMSWNFVKNGETQKLISYSQDENGEYYQVYKENSVVSLKADVDYSKAFLASLFNSSELVARK